ncbi:MAG: CHAD domain-containing protein [Oceanipulchritudo sp.]
MGYRLQPARERSAECRRVFDKGLLEALTRLDLYPETDTEGLHEARKNIKRIRSLLRLLRNRTFNPRRKELNAGLRSINQSLSSNRDREVQIALLKQWSDRPASEGTLREACRRLASFHERETQPHPDIDPALRLHIHRRMAEIRHTLQNADLGKISGKRLRKTLERREGNMLEARMDFMENPGIDTLHNWRKRLKDLMYQRDLVRDVLGLKAGKTKRIKKLEGLLSDARDCDLLLENLRGGVHGDLPAVQIGVLVYHFESEKERLLGKAGKLSGKLFGPLTPRRPQSGSEPQSSPGPTPPAGNG